MPDVNEYYLTGLRNQHSVEGQAVSTIEAQLSRMADYPELHAKMQQEIESSKTQATRLETLLSKHGTSASAAKETVTSVVGKVSGLVHVTAPDEVVKNVMAAIGFKAYEIASYKALITMAEAAGAQDDVAVLKQSQTEEMALGDWLGEHLPGFVTQFLHSSK
jgi:ferritin-like metal-binding protein YciE